MIEYMIYLIFYRVPPNSTLFNILINLQNNFYPHYKYNTY